MALSKIDSDGIVANGITADSLNIGQIGGRRNLIINGAMQVAQRGTSETGVTTTGVFVVDRFVNNVSDTAEFTISQSTTAPTGFANSLKWENTTANPSPSSTEYVTINHRIEAQNLQHLKFGTSDAQSVTLSFWVRSNKTGTYVAELLQPDASNRHINKSYTINSADTWEQKTITFEGDTSGVINNDNGVGLIVTWWLNAGSVFNSGTLQTSWGALDQIARAVGQVSLADTIGNDFYITGVQLETGSVATPFERRFYGQELALCQRYFQVTKYKGVGTAANSQNLGLNVDFVVPMRTVPDVTKTTGTLTFSDLYASGYATSTAAVAIGTSRSENDHVRIDITTGWSPALNTGRVLVYSSTGVAANDARLFFSAEL